MNEKAAKVGKSGSLGKIFGSDEFGVFLPLLGIIVVTTVLRPDFLSVSNFSAMLGQVTFIALTALGASFPLMVGQVDISTGRVAGFAGIIMSSMVVEHGMGALPAILLALVACLIVGVINGILVVYLEVPDFVATMGTLYMVGGARYLFVKGYQFSLNTQENFPLVEIFDGRYLGMPLYFWIMVLIFVLVYHHQEDSVGAETSGHRRQPRGSGASGYQYQQDAHGSLYDFRISGGYRRTSDYAGCRYRSSGDRRRLGVPRDSRLCSRRRQPGGRQGFTPWCADWNRVGICGGERDYLLGMSGNHEGSCAGTSDGRSGTD